MSRKIVFASHNMGKFVEMQNMLKYYNIELIMQAEFGVESIEETGLSFIENAILKARHAAAVTGLESLADDSGLEVDFLQGAPGIYSARYAGYDADFSANMKKLLINMQPATNRSARFVCVLALVNSAKDATPKIYSGFWSGLIATDLSGNQGFGYDPVFYYPPLKKTFAQMSLEDKNRVSHRGKAMGELRGEFDKVLIWLKHRLTEEPP